MKSFEPAMAAPPGPPKPFEKSIQIASTGLAHLSTATLVAATALNTRAPSVNTATPRSWARAATAWYRSQGHTVPPAKLWVCSRATRAVRD
jgi:hypothetical protein